MFPILSTILFLPLVGALLILLIPRESPNTIKRLGIIFACTSLALAIYIWVLVAQVNAAEADSMAYPMENYPWITAASFDVHYKLEADGLSAPMLSLTALVTTLALFYSSHTIQVRVKEYFALFLLFETSMLGVFLARDLVLFYIFWVVGLLPMLLLISIWGGEQRERAAIKFFLYNLLGSVVMLMVIVAVYAQVKTFDMAQAAEIGPYAADDYFTEACIAFGALFVAFVIRLPSIPFHTWLPDAQTEAPTAASAAMAGAFLTTAGYGLIRVVLPLFPTPFYYFSIQVWVLPALAVGSIIYGALVCMAQWDLKRLVSYISVMQMGFTTLGVCAAAVGHAILSSKIAFEGMLLDPQATLNAAASGLNGAAMQLFAQGIVIAMLFFLVGILYRRTQTYDIKLLGGFARQIPHYYGLMLVAGFAALGLPGLIGFWGELFIFKSVVGLIPGSAFIGGLGLLLAAAYTLWKIVQHIFLGTLDEERWGQLEDMTWWERLTVWPLVIVTVAFGFYPTLLLDMFNTALTALLERLS